MKVKCRCCGRQFDYDVHSGQCPKCVSYYRMEEEPKIQYVTSTTDQKPTSDEQAFESTVDKVSAPRHSKQYYILTIILLLAILLIGAVPISIAYFQNQANFDEMAKASIVTPKELKVGEAFDYAIQDYDYSDGEEKMVTYQVEITGVHYDTDSRLMLPEGYEMVVAEYKVDAPYKKSDVPGMEDSSLALSYGVKIDSYLLTKQEQYICPFDARKIQNMKGEDRAPFVTEDFYYEKGELYFLVKQGDTEGLWLNCMEPGDRVNKLKESYVIRNMEVK